MGWMSGALAVVCLGVGLFHLVRLAVRRRDAASELAHAVMGLGMAAMFSPLGDPVPAPVWTAVFLVCAAWFGAALLRTRAAGGETAHHVVGSGAMLFMLLAGHAAPAGDGGAHAAHGGGGAGTLGLASVVALVLTAYFAWHALCCAERCRRGSTDAPDGTGASGGGLRWLAASGAPGGARAGAAAGSALPWPAAPGGVGTLRASAASLTAPQTAAVAHLLMAVAMAVMLFGMV